MAVAASKKESLSLCLEVIQFDVEEKLPTMAALFWTEGARVNRWRREQTRFWAEGVDQSGLPAGCAEDTVAKTPGLSIGKEDAVEPRIILGGAGSSSLPCRSRKEEKRIENVLPSDREGSIFTSCRCFFACFVLGEVVSAWEVSEADL